MRQKQAPKLATGQLGKKKVPEDFRILGMLKRNGHYLTTTLQNYPWKVGGKYYWDNKKYNEFNARAGVGLGYQTARLEVSLMPFTEKRWYAGGSSGGKAMKQYSKNSGARLDLSNWLNEKWTNFDRT